MVCRLSPLWRRSRRCSRAGARGLRRSPRRVRHGGAGSQPPRKKRVPPGAKGFENYATRDASDKLATGAATRSPDVQKLIDEGTERYARNDFVGAASLFEQATRLAPDSPGAHYNLGAALLQLDRYEDAAAQFRQALGCHPDGDLPLMATYDLGNAYLDAGKYEEARERFLEAIRLDPSQATPHNNLGLAYVALGKTEAAVDSFARAVRMRDDYAEARFNFALALWQSGRRTEARAEQEKLRRLDASQAARLDQLFK